MQALIDACNLPENVRTQKTPKLAYHLSFWNARKAPAGFTCVRGPDGETISDPTRVSEALASHWSEQFAAKAVDHAALERFLDRWVAPSTHLPTNWIVSR